MYTHGPSQTNPGVLCGIEIEGHSFPWISLIFPVYMMKRFFLLYWESSIYFVGQIFIYWFVYSNEISSTVDCCGFILTLRSGCIWPQIFFFSIFKTVFATIDPTNFHNGEINFRIYFSPSIKTTSSKFY